MKLAIQQPARSRRAFTLTELMVAVGIMGLIVTALYSVFSQTQRALRANVSQTDIAEGGRFAMELITRDLRRLSAAGQTPETNFLVTLSPAIPSWPVGTLKADQLFELYYETNRPADLSGYQPTIQRLNVGQAYRTNLLEEMFLFAREGTRMAGTLYRVINARGGVGTLGRYSHTYDHRLMPAGWLSIATLGRAATNFAPLVEGVVHFHVQAFDANGYPMTWTNRLWYVQGTTNYPNPGYRLREDLLLDQDERSDLVTVTIFRSNALPAAVEIELGVLEPDALAQYRQLPAGSDLARSFLSNRTAQVHLFRQRVPIWQATSLLSAQSARP